MVLVKKLSSEDMERHRSLITSCFQELLGKPDVLIEFHGNGVEKGVYKVTSGEDTYLAAAASINKNRRLLEEYNILTQLYGGAQEFFPRPVAHYVPPNVQNTGDVYLMEFLPHLDLDRFDKFSYNNGTGLQRELSYQLGRAVAIVNVRTGRYSSEPHNGNILARVTESGVLDLKFCDAIQFRTGNIEDAVQAVLVNKNERPESFRFIKKFRSGLAEGLSCSLGIPSDEAWDRLNFLRQYNDVF